MLTLGSTELHRLATAPQALDNQCFPDLALAMMYEDDPYPELNEAVQILRTAAVRREWHRSLLYSPQVILNRAFAVNEPVIFEGVARHPEAFAQLFASGRLVIHLLNLSKRMGSGQVRTEESLEDFLEDPPFAINSEGKQAWMAYLRAGHPIRYLRLNNDEDAKVVDRFSTTIGSLCSDMLDAERARLLLHGLRGLHTDTHQGGQSEINGDLGIDHAQFGEFCSTELDQWVKQTTRQGGKVAVSRGRFYQRFVLPDGVASNTNTIDPSKPYSMELKLFADLVYNNNVPTAVGAFSFIPSGLPDPRCIPPALRGDRPPKGAARDRAAAELAAELSAAAHRGQLEDEYIYGLQRELVLYDWASMSIADVVELIFDPESGLNAMIAAMDNVMDFSGVADFRQKLSGVGATVEAFQSYLHGRAATKGWVPLSREPLKMIVRPALIVAGQVVASEFSASRMHAAMISAVATRAADVAIDAVVDFVAKGKKKRFARDRRAALAQTVATIGDSAMAANTIAPMEGRPRPDEHHPRFDDVNRRC